MAYFHKITRLHLLASAAVLLAAPAAATTFSASTNYAFSGTQSLGTYGAGQQSIGTDFGGSAGFGGVGEKCEHVPAVGDVCSGQYGADANVSVNGNIGLSVDTGFSGSQATLNYGGTATTTVSALGGGRYGIGFNAAPTSQSFSDTGAVASLAIGGNFGLSASVGGRACFVSCTGGSGTLFSFNAGGNILSASNAGSGSLSVFGVAVPGGITLDQQKSISVLNATLNSVGGTISGTNSVSITNPVFAASVDLVKVAAKVLDLPRTSVDINLGIGSASLAIGSVDAGVALGLTRNDMAKVSPTIQTLYFENRKTGSLVEVPLLFERHTYIFNPTGTGYINGVYTSCAQSGGHDSVDTFVDGFSGVGNNSAPNFCFVKNITTFTRLQSSVSGSQGALHIRVGDGSFDFSNVKIVSQAAISGQVSSQRSLVIGGTISAALGTGNVSLDFAGQSLNEGFGPLVNVSKTFAQTSQDLGTHSTSFGDTNTHTVIGFDGTTARNAVAYIDAVDAGKVTIGAQRVGGALTRTITISNTAANDGFSDGLQYGLHSSGAARVGTQGSAVGGSVAAGESAGIAVGVDTSVSGRLAGVVKIVTAGDGSQTGNSKLFTVDAVTVTGNVYAPAVANYANTRAIDFGVVRVGDRATRNIAITNGAAGALTDSLLSRTFLGLGSFTYGDAPGPLAAGQTGNIAVSLDTSTAGHNGGKLGLTFTSHDGELADINVGANIWNVSGTVNNHAAPTFLFNGHAIKFDAGRDAFVYNAGNTFNWSGRSLKGFAVGNLVSGPADTLVGEVNPYGSGNGILTLASTFYVDPLSAGQSSGQFGFAISPGLLGLYWSVFDFTGWGQNASDTIGEHRNARLYVYTNFVPEPAAIALFGLGAFGLLARRRQLARAAQNC